MFTWGLGVHLEVNMHIRPGILLGPYVHLRLVSVWGLGVKQGLIYTWSTVSTWGLIST